MPKLTLDNIGSFSQDAITTINQNNNRIEEALEKTLSRDGTIPNQLESDLDLNHHDLLNISDLKVESVTIGDTPITEDQVVIRDDLGLVAFSNNYNDLDNLPTAPIGIVSSVNGRQGDVLLTKADVSLENVDNTSDADKPISTLTQTALNDKANSSVTITAGTGLTGGGTIAESRTIALSSTSIASLALADSAVQDSDLGDLALIDFPAVPSGNVLNDTGNWVPQGGGEGGGQVNSVVAGTGITVDSTDPTNPIVSVTGGGSGSVTSVALSVPTGLSVSGSPITTSGTFAVTYASGYQGYTSAEADKLSGIASGATANTGTVTSVGLSLPTGLSVSGSPITTSGSFTVTFAAGYSIPTTTKQGQWDTAYGWGNHASAGYLTSAAIGSTVQGYDAATTKNGATQTLTNKRITPRVGSTASSSTPTPDGDANDVYAVTALAAAATIGAPTGTPTDGQKLIMRIKDNGTARALTWNAAYRGIVSALPSTTIISKTLYLGFIYNSADSKWDLVAVSQEV